MCPIYLGVVGKGFPEGTATLVSSALKSVTDEQLKEKALALVKTVLQII